MHGAPEPLPQCTISLHARATWLSVECPLEPCNARLLDWAPTTIPRVRCRAAQATRLSSLPSCAGHTPRPLSGGRLSPACRLGVLECARRTTAASNPTQAGASSGGGGHGGTHSSCAGRPQVWGHCGSCRVCLTSFATFYVRRRLGAAGTHGPQPRSFWLARLACACLLPWQRRRRCGRRRRRVAGARLHSIARPTHCSPTGTPQ